VSGRNSFDGLVLAAGFGARLGGRPKAFLPIGGATALDRAVTALAALGARRVLVVHNARWAGSFDRWARERAQDGLELLNDGATCDQDRLGAAGDLRLGLAALAHDVVAVPVDNVWTWPMQLMADRLAPCASYPAIVVRPIGEHSGQLGRVDMDERGRVLNFYDMSPKAGGDLPWAPWVWLGPAWLPQDAHGDVSEYCASEARSGRLPDSLGGLVRWLARRRRVHGLQIAEGEAFDVGTPTGLANAQAALGP
jgi:NDP-sugar pyrophosphorylase family protein